MKTLKNEQIKTDVLVIGGGMAGLFAAIKAREAGAEVTLIDKGTVGKAGGVFIAEGFFSVFNPAWGHDLNDWMSQVALAGDYMNNPDWTKITLQDSYDRYQDLLSWGVTFLRGEDGELLRYKRGALESLLIGMGWTWFPAMRKQTLEKGIRIIDRVMVTDLLKAEGRVVGAVGFHTRDGNFYTILAGATVLCARGGSGEAMAYRAGAEIRSKEFFSGTGAFTFAGNEYYGTEADIPKISLEGRETKSPPPGGWDGGAIHYIDKYVDAEGNRINRYTVGVAVHEGRAPILWNLDDATPQELSDVLRENEQGGTSFKMERVGFDLSRGGLYHGMLHYEGGIVGQGSIGGGAGIWSADTECGTSLPGLYAAGDNYSTKAVGAKYPYWGFGLRNAAVTGARAGSSAATYALKARQTTADPDEIERLRKVVYGPLERRGGFDSAWVLKQLSGITGPYYVCLIRHGERLEAALRLVAFVHRHTGPKIYAKDAHGLRFAHEAKSTILNAEMGLRSALFRTESRGTHYREDYPHRDDPDWLASVKIRERDGEMELIKEPHPKAWWPDLSLPYEDRYLTKYPGEL